MKGLRWCTSVSQRPVSREREKCFAASADARRRGCAPHELEARRRRQRPPRRSNREPQRRLRRC
eukprot:219861-Prymnesium_polylepis.1